MINFCDCRLESCRKTGVKPFVPAGYKNGLDMALYMANGLTGKESHMTVLTILAGIMLHKGKIQT